MFPLGKQMQADGKNKSMAAPLPQPLGVVWLALGSVMRGIQRGNWLELIEGQGFMLICSEPWVFLMVFLVTGLGFVGKILPRKNMVFVHQIDWDFPGKMFPSINPMIRITIGWDEFICVSSHTK